MYGHTKSNQQPLGTIRNRPDTIGNCRDAPKIARLLVHHPIM